MWDHRWISLFTVICQYLWIMRIFINVISHDQHKQEDASILEKKNLRIKQVLGAWWHLLRSTSLPLLSANRYSSCPISRKKGNSRHFPALTSQLLCFTLHIACCPPFRGRGFLSPLLGPFSLASSVSLLLLASFPTEFPPLKPFPHSLLFSQTPQRSVYPC